MPKASKGCLQQGTKRDYLTSQVRLIDKKLRGAFLLDEHLGAISAEQVVEVISHIELTNPNDLIVVKLSFEDVLIIGAETLRGKIKALELWSEGLHPILVQVDGVSETAVCGEDPRLLSPEERACIVSVLLDCCLGPIISHLEEGIMMIKKRKHEIPILTFDKVELLEQVVGWPFVAGWLLGYPCIYHSVVRDKETLLAMQPLKKYAFVLQGKSPSVDLDLMSFTIPVCLLADEHVAAKLDASLEDIKSQHAKAGRTQDMEVTLIESTQTLATVAI